MKNADITYFNYEHLNRVGRGDPNAIIILTHGIIRSYNNTMGITSQKLMNDLNVHQIPRFLFQQGTLYTKNNLIYSRYSTKEPQSYMRNCDFLFYQIDVKYKMLYLKALSKRRINEDTDEIPLDYFREVVDSPLWRFDGNNIYLYLESLKRE